VNAFFDQLVVDALSVAVFFQRFRGPRPERKCHRRFVARQSYPVRGPSKKPTTCALARSRSVAKSATSSRSRYVGAIIDGVPGNRIHAIINRTRAITGDTDLRLCKFFGLSEGYFLRLQNAYDMLEAKRRIAVQLAKIKPYKRAKAA
jgi:plasmid maintenance system antidote protein VapI